MQDPKGIYNSPSAQGWATVLSPGPNFMGMAMQREQMKARREQLALQAQAKADAEREKQIGRIVQDLSKPTPTAFPYQEEVNKRKSALLTEIEKMYMDGADASDIRFKSATGVQDLVGFATAGKQLYEGILSQTKQLDKKKYNIGAITTGLTEKIVGDGGSIIDPQTLDMNDLNAAEFVYSSPRPWDYLNQNAVVADFLKNPKFKDEISEIQRNLDAGKIGRFTTFNEGTRIEKGIGALYDINAVSGDVKLLDPATLIQNGVFQLMLADRDMAAVVEGEVEKLTENRNTPLEGKARDMLRASVLQDILSKSAPGPQTIERVSQRQAPTNTSSGGGKPTTAQQEYTAGEQFVRDFRSGKREVVNKALDYAMGGKYLQDLLPEGTIAPSEKLERVVHNGNELQFSISEFNDDGKLRTKMVDGEKTPIRRYVTVPINELSDEVIRNLHSHSAKDVGRFYDTTETGERPITTQQSPPAVQFSIFKKK